MARVITAKRADTCGACGQPIAAGEQINYGGPGAVSHESCAPVDAAPRKSRRLARGQYGYRGYAGYSSRCEDAPCCGCCD